MPTSRQRQRFERGRHELVRLSHAGFERRELLRRAADVLGEAVQFDGACWHSHDPATLLITTHETNMDGSGFTLVCRNEYLQPDANKFADLARRRYPAAVLGESFRLRELYRPRGWGSELRGTFGSADATWGSVMLLRERSRPGFTADEASFLASVSRHLGHGLRRALLASDDLATVEDAPGVVVVDEHDQPQQVTDAAALWLSELDYAGETEPALPAALLALAARTRAIAARPETAVEPAFARVQTRSGVWLALHGSLLGDRVAVVLQPASPLQLAPLVAAAYGLTPREREIASMLLRAHAIQEIALKLRLSPHTVQDHAKAIYEKTGARGRLDLSARLFYQHAQPHLAAGVEPGPSGWFAG
jgi:DNA-binding CsgD family transcriptional regulator